MTIPPSPRKSSGDSSQTRLLAQRACFDCHSNESVWPWYAYVAPISLRVASHVQNGRQHLNFSEWDQPNEDFDEIEKVISRGQMPLSDYLLLHPEAELSAAEKQQLIAGLQAPWPTIRQSSGKTRADRKRRIV